MMDMNGSSVDHEVLSHDHSTIYVKYISKLWSEMKISSTGNEEDVILDVFEVNESAGFNLGEY